MQDLLPNTKLSHYRIASKISAGGMGEVYLAEDLEWKWRVALKLLFHDLHQNETFLRRFRQEAQAVSALNHPNIVTVYEIGSWQDRQYIAMEFVEGSNLRYLIEKQEITLRDALDIAIQAASGLRKRRTSPESFIETSNRKISSADRMDWSRCWISV